MILFILLAMLSKRNMGKFDFTSFIMGSNFILSASRRRSTVFSSMYTVVFKSWGKMEVDVFTGLVSIDNSSVTSKAC